MTHHFSCGVEAAKCYFGQKVVDENDYVLIPNAIDVERFIYNPKIRNKIRKENDLENKHVVGHVGRFMAQKNHTFLVDVFAEVLKIDSQAHLVLLGDGELMDEIKRKAADLGISEHVTFVGNVGNANEWYQAFDCFVLPSIWEGLPVVGVEAQRTFRVSFRQPLQEKLGCHSVQNLFRSQNLFLYGQKHCVMRCSRMSVMTTRS